VRIPYLNRRRKKVITVVVACFSLSQNVFLAHTTETNLWRDRQLAIKNLQAPPLSLSSSAKKTSFESSAPSWIESAIRPFGSVVRVDLSKSPRAKTVILLQDAHLHAEAQANIAGMLESLHEKSASWNPELLVGLEGVDNDEIDFSAYRRYPHPASMRKMIKGMLNAHIFNGVEAAGASATGPGLIRVVGVEDKRQYDANVEALRASLPFKEETARALTSLKQEIEVQKKHYNPSLAAFDSKTTGFEEGRIGLADYALILNSIRPAKSPNLKFLVEASQLEKTLDIKKTELERERFLKALLVRISPLETTALLDMSAGFKTGSFSYGDYYRKLKELSKKFGVPLTSYPALDGYISYVVASESVDTQKIFKEVREAEQAVVTKLARRPD
jgi:hypothetical protein